MDMTGEDLYPPKHAWFPVHLHSYVATWMGLEVAFLLRASICIRIGSVAKTCTRCHMQNEYLP